MPSDTPPVSERRSSKLGGCVAVLFQLLHGKRLFPRKSLPGERPKQDSFTHPDDKLPVAKLLLIADENNCGLPKDIPEGFQEGGASKDEPCEGKSPSRRTPSVVARLMGLDTMPPLEPAFDDDKCLDAYKDVACQASANVPQERENVLSKNRKGIASIWQHAPLSVDRTKESRRDLTEKFVTRRKVPRSAKEEVQGEVVKNKVLSKSRPLSTPRLDSAYSKVISASTENCINIGNKKTGILSRRVKEPMKKGAKDNLTSEANWSRKVEGRAQKKSKATVIKRLSTPIAPIEGYGRTHHISYVGSQQLHDGAKGSLWESGPSKRKASYPQGVMQPRAHVSEKVMVDGRQQAETSQRLSQVAATSNSIKTQGSRVSGSALDRRTSPHSRSVPISSEDSNSARSSGPGSGSSQTISFHTGRNGVTCKSPRRLPNLLVEDLSSQAEEDGDGAQALYGGRVVLLHEDRSISQGPSIPDLMQGCSTSEEDTSSSSSTIYTEIFQRSSMESSLSSDQSLPDVTTSLGDGLSFLRSADVAEGERVPEGWERGAVLAPLGCERASGIDILSTEESLPSNLDSVRGDTASSSSYCKTDAVALRPKQAPSYSGKNTAAILQELLVALRSSKSHQNSDDKIKIPSCAKDMESFLLERYPKQGGKSVVSFQDGMIADSCTEVGDQQNTMSSTEPSCQDLPSYSSSQSFDTRQGKEASETNDCLQCVDCTSISETQVQDEGVTITSNFGGTPALFMENIGVPDCEALMKTISKLHHIDPEVIGLNVKTTMHHKEKMFQGSGCDTSKHSIDSREEDHHLDMGVQFYSTSLSVEDDAESLYRSEMESGLKNEYEEEAAQKKKLLSDCINEALKSLSRGLYACSSVSGPSSAASHVLHRVYAQIDEWKGMSISMNLDNMVEKEMENVARGWQSIVLEKEKVMKVVESSIFGGLLEEVLLELI